MTIKSIVRVADAVTGAEGVLCEDTIYFPR